MKLPYYLHHPDPAKGTAHFWLSQEEGLKIYQTLQARLSGYLVPKYVWENTEVPYKTLVGQGAA